MKKAATLIFCFFAVLVATCSANGEIYRIEILGFGTYEFLAKKSVSDGEMPWQRRSLVLPRIINEGKDVIEGRVGVYFGFHYTIIGEPIGAPVTLRTVVIFPSPGLTNAAGKVASNSVYVVARTIGETYSVGYGFDEAGEILPGKWIIQLWHEDEMLAEKSFLIIEGH